MSTKNCTSVKEATGPVTLVAASDHPGHFPTSSMMVNHVPYQSARSTGRVRGCLGTVSDVGSVTDDDNME